MKKDYELNAEVRKILVEERVDMDTVYAKVVGQILIIEGIMKKKNGDITSLPPPIMDKIEKRLNGLRDLNRIRFRLENFVKVDGDWRHMISKQLERSNKKAVFSVDRLKKMVPGEGGERTGFSLPAKSN